MTNLNIAERYNPTEGKNKTTIRLDENLNITYPNKLF